MLSYNLHTRSLKNHWAWDHMHAAVSSVPLLPHDMYEHAYHMDYGTAAAKYVDAFTDNVNWSEVNRRFMRAVKMASVRPGLTESALWSVQSTDDKTTLSAAPVDAVDHGISFSEAVRVWVQIALLSFGGPAWQIVVMHRILVEEKRWIGVERFLPALN